MAKKQDILATPLWDAFPNNQDLDLPEPFEDESVQTYRARCQDMKATRHPFSNDSLFQYIIYCACDAKGDVEQLRRDLDSGLRDLAVVSSVVWEDVITG